MRWWGLLFASTLLAGLCLGCAPAQLTLSKLNLLDASVELMRQQLELMSDQVTEETNMIIDLRDFGGCSNYETVRQRHLEAFSKLRERNDALSAKLNQLHQGGK
jgi:hypothetical protein